MKNYRLKVLCLVLFAGVLLNVGPKVFAQNAPPPNWQSGAEGSWYVNVDEGDPLNVRSLPSHKSTKIGVVVRGTEVNILDT